MSVPTVIVKSRLPWEALFVQPLTQMTDNGVIGGTKGQCQKIALLYDTVVKTGGCNFPPTGPTPPAPAMGNMKGFETAFFIGYKAAEVMNFIKALPALLMGELKKLIKKYTDKLKKFYEEWKKEHEPLIKKIKKLIQIAKSLIKVVLLFMQGQIKEAINEGAAAGLPGFKWLKEKMDSIPTKEELMKKIKKVISNIKNWINKKLEPIKARWRKIKTWIENKLKEIKDKILKGIAKRIAVAALKKAGYTKAQAQAAAGTYIDTVEATKAMIKTKILSIKAMIIKIKIIIGNIAKLAAWILKAAALPVAVYTLVTQLSRLRKLLKPPQVRVGFGKMNLNIPPETSKKIFKKVLDKIELPELPDMSLNLGAELEIPDISINTEGEAVPVKKSKKINWDVRSAEFNLPELPTVPSVEEVVSELEKKGREAIEKNPALKRKVNKVKAFIQKKKEWIENKLEWIKRKVKAAMQFIKDLKKNIIKKAKEYAIKLLIKMLPPRGADPTEKIRILNAKIKKVQDLIKKIKKIKDEILAKIKLVLKTIKMIMRKIAAAIKIIQLLTEFTLSLMLNTAPLYQAAEIANKEFNAGIDTSITPAEIRRAIIKKILGKHYPKWQKRIEKWKAKLNKLKKRIEDKLRPIIARFKAFVAMVKALMGLVVALISTSSGKLIAAAMSVALLTYWTGASVALPGGRVVFPGLPLQALPKINGKSAAEIISKDVFNEESELSTADKYRSLANVFETHMKTVAGMWMMPAPNGAIPTPWISYG